MQAYFSHKKSGVVVWIHWATVAIMECLAEAMNIDTLF